MDGDGIRIVRSDGRELVATAGITDNGWTVSWQGLEDFLTLPITVRTSANVLTDGSSFLSERVEEADRTASLVYVGPRDPRGVRDEALSFFNPRHTFAVHVTHMGVTRWCEGRLTDRQCVIRPERYPCEVTFTILCMDPFMRSEDHNESSLTDAAPMFGFPYVSHVRQVLPDGGKKPVGFLASKMLYDGLNTIYNSGDVETYCRIVCSFDGPVTNPKFTKDDRFVQVLRAFKDGDELEIDFESAPPRVLVNGTNAIQLCSRDSNFTGMQMQVGPNVFQYEGSTTAERAYMHVQVLFYKRYLGV